MGQSFYTSIGGIKAAQSNINVVSDNLANLNTPGYKESSVAFSDVYYNTISTGSAATNNLGGTNPKQIGLGTQVSAIARNFTNGGTQTTGVDTDMNIQGGGFFTVQDQSGNTLYSRAGNFILDSDGNLSLPSGCRLMGTSSSFSTKGSADLIKVPTAMKVSCVANTGVMDTKALSDLNSAPISDGTFTMSVKASAGATPVSVSVTIGAAAGVDSMQDIVSSVNSKLTAAGLTGFTASLTNGKFTVTPPAGGTMTFADGTSNFVRSTDIASSPAAGPYASKVLDYKEVVTPSDNSSSSITYTGMSVSENGTIEAKYSNGDKLTVYQDSSGSMEFKYTTADGIVIKGDDAQITPTVAKPANLQLQLANFVNPNGLVAEGGNAYSKGPDCGEAFYGTPGASGFGKMQTGALESSNVDMTRQFANMIISQRAIEANSRVFNSQNEIMRTLANIGQ